ncbi:hypothetical protein GCM10020254_75240 [Streptomyces goshikiensis]
MQTVSSSTRSRSAGGSWASRSASDPGVSAAAPTLVLRRTGVRSRPRSEGCDGVAHLRLERGEVEPGGYEQALGRGAQSGVEEGQAVGGGQRVHAAAVEASPVLFVEGGGHAGLVVPQAPGEREARQVLCPAVLGEGVEEGVARGVVGLSGVAEHAGRRGEQDERRQVEVPGQLVQVPGRVGLGPQHPRDPLGG